jgi:hypothetical protein
VEEEKEFHIGEGSKIANSSLATQIKDINGLVVKKRQTVKVCTEVLEAMQKKIVDLLYKMNSAEGRLHSAKVQVLGLENIDGNDVHKFGLAKVQDSILELEKICHEIGEVRYELKAKVEHHKHELTKLHHYEVCLDRLKQKTDVEMEVQEGSSLTSFLRVFHCSWSMFLLKRLLAGLGLGKPCTEGEGCLASSLFLHTHKSSYTCTWMGVFVSPN